MRQSFNQKTQPNYSVSQKLKIILKLHITNKKSNITIAPQTPLTTKVLQLKKFIICNANNKFKSFTVNCIVITLPNIHIKHNSNKSAAQLFFKTAICTKHTLN